MQRLAFTISILLAALCTPAFAPPPDDDLPNTDLARRLAPDEYRRVIRAVMLAERSLLDYRKWEERKNLTKGSGALHPDDALGYCGEAMESVAHFLRRQGAEAKNVQLFQLWGEQNGLFGENSFRHVVVVYQAKDREGKTVPVVIDPTFAQIYGWRADTGATTAERAEIKKNKLSPAAILSQSAYGQRMLGYLEGEGAWIATDFALSQWGEAMTSDETGKKRPHKKPKVADLAEGNMLLTSRVGETARLVSGLTDAGIDKALEDIDATAIQKRVDEGRSVLFRLGGNFLPAAVAKQLTWLEMLIRSSALYTREYHRLLYGEPLDPSTLPELPEKERVASDGGPPPDLRRLDPMTVEDFTRTADTAVDLARRLPALPPGWTLEHSPLPHDQRVLTAIRCHFVLARIGDLIRQRPR